MNQLWLDDLRPAPEGWFWAKTYHEAVEFLTRVKDCVDASLDHDLGYADPNDPFRSDDDLDFSSGEPDWLYRYNNSARTGYDLVQWIVKNEAWPSNSVAVHSANPAGVESMVGLINRFGGYRNKMSFTKGHRNTWGVLFYGKD